MGFPRQEWCCGLPFSSAGDLPDPGIEPASPTCAGGLLPLHLLGSPQIRELMKTDSRALPSGNADVLDVATLEQHCPEHGPYPGILRHGSL